MGRITFVIPSRNNLEFLQLAYKSIRNLKDNHEICSHGLRWINYNGIKEDIERAHMKEAIEISVVMSYQME